MGQYFYRLSLPVLVLLLVSCAQPHSQSTTAKGWYRVKPNDTLYSIAWRYGLDYKALARWNRIDVRAKIFPGQRLILIEPDAIDQAPAQAAVVAVPDVTHRSVAPAIPLKPFEGKPKNWLWPTQGRVLSTFSALQVNRQGINIGGQLGQPVHAAAAGKVVYSGNGLSDYGNLIIVQHGDMFLSAYAYNQVRLVTEGAWVKAGAVIARMGAHETGKARLHFQIRKNGKAVDPLHFLPKH